MTKKTKTILAILISLLLIAGIGVAVLATTDLGKGTIFQKEKNETVLNEPKNEPEENTSTSDNANAEEDRIIVEEEGLHDDGLIYFNMTREDLETQEAREATFERLLSLIPEDYKFEDGDTPEEVVRSAIERNLLFYHAEEIADNCPWGYFIWDPIFLNDDLTINTDKAYGMIYENNVNIEPWCTYTPQGYVITTVNDTETYHEVYNDMSQASGWNLEAFNTACEWVEAKNNGRFEVTKTATYFKASDEHGCFTEIDFNNKYIKNREVYYTTQEMIDRFYEESDVFTPEEYKEYWTKKDISFSVLY